MCSIALYFYHVFDKRCTTICAQFTLSKLPQWRKPSGEYGESHLPIPYRGDVGGGTPASTYPPDCVGRLISGLPPHRVKLPKLDANSFLGLQPSLVLKEHKSGLVPPHPKQHVYVLTPPFFMISDLRTTKKRLRPLPHQKNAKTWYPQRTPCKFF